MRSLTLVALFSASLTLAAGHAHAIISAVTDGRTLHAEFFDPYFSQVLDDAPTTAFAAWDDDAIAGGAYYAQQSSEAITSTRMAASGSADGFSEQGAANSTFSIIFDVAETVSYRLSGSLSENPSAFNASQIRLTQGLATVFEAAADFDTIQFLDTGVLTPGRYMLFAEADWNETGEFLPPGSATFDFVFQVVPEPGTGLLVGFGCLALAWHRGRR